MSDTRSTGSSGTTMQDRAGEMAGKTREQAGEVASTAKEQASSVASAAGEQARSVADDAKREAQHLIDDGRQRLREQAGEQSRRAASSLRDLGDQLERMASGQQAEGPAVDWAREAGHRIQSLADSMESRRPEDLLEDVKRFARQRPGMFVMGAVGAGFLAARVLRTTDTSSLKDAAKSGAGMSSGPQHQRGAHEMVSGPGQTAPGQTAIPAATTPVGGMAGTAPADLAEPAPGTLGHPPRTEPLRSPGQGSPR